MTISTFAELKSAIQNWFMDRGDIVTVAGDEIIALAEGYFNLNLRCREMQTVADLTPDGDGVCTLPSDFIEYIGVGELASPRRSLEPLDFDMVDVYYPSSTAGLSNHFTIFGTTLIAYPISANDMRLAYYQAIPPLSVSNTTNWLLTKSPNLYLHTCLLYAAEFSKDSGGERETEAALVGKFVDLVNAASVRATMYNTGMTPRGPTP